MPRTRPGRSALREPLSYALGTVAKLSALRVLASAGAPLTQRDVARRAGVQHRSIQLALDELVALGIVARLEGGRDYLVRLDEEHRLFAALQSLFAAEAEHFLSVRMRLADAASRIAPRTGLVSLVLFGSAARGDDRPDSDCDLLVVARDASGLDKALDALHALAEPLRRTHGCRIRPIGYTVRDATRAWRARQTPFTDIRRDGLVLFGPALTESLVG